MDECELAYLRYQADRLLASEGWYEIPLGRRNVGIKMVGVLEYWQHLPLLLQILGDRTPIGPVAGMCGGDYLHGGILRRNAVEHGLRRLGAADAETEGALLAALADDPYFEVRAWAARALGESFAVDEAIETALCAALDDDAFPTNRFKAQVIVCRCVHPFPGSTAEGAHHAKIAYPPRWV